MAYKLIKRIPVADTGLAVTLSVQAGSLLDRIMTGEPKHSWNDVLRVLQRYYIQMAVELNALAADALQASLKRPNVSTGRLDAAIRSEKNVVLRDTGFYVGVDKWMQQSEAKYWRQIDRGSTRHLGQRLVGYWGGSWTGTWERSSPWAERWNMAYPVVGGPYRRSGGGRGQDFVPSAGATDEARKRLRGLLDSTQRVRLNSKYGMTYYAPTAPKSEAGTRIRRPIEAENYYERAMAQFRRTNRPLNLLREVIAQEFGIAKSAVPRSAAGLGGFL